MRTALFIALVACMTACSTEGTVIPGATDNRTPDAGAEVRTDSKPADSPMSELPAEIRSDAATKPETPDSDEGEDAPSPSDSLLPDETLQTDYVPEETSADTPSVPCQVDEECSDGDDCTFDQCTSGLCSHQDMPYGYCCQEDADCNDGITCTEDSCNAGKCFNIPESNLCCSDESDCQDFDDCTNDVCVGSKCAHIFFANDTVCQCSSFLDCYDGLSCTNDFCKEGECIWEENPAGGFCCSSDQDCQDGDPSTTDQCVQLTCSNMPVTSCLADSHCDDGDICTDDQCVDEECQHEPVEGCCHVDGECNDPFGITIDRCIGATCIHSLTKELVNCENDLTCIAKGSDCLVAECAAQLCSYTLADFPGCCANEAQCDEGDPCTVDKCTDFHCIQSPAQGPVLQAGWDFDEAGLAGFEVVGDGSAVKWQLFDKMYISAPTSLYFGDPNGPTIDNGGVPQGSVKTPEVQLAFADPIKFTFWTYVHVEPLYSKDLVWITIQEGGGAKTEIWSKADIGGSTGMAWKQVELTLSDFGNFMGKKVRFTFHFDATDNISNDYEGIYVDDIELHWPCQ